ncbi:MAG: HypC/HybG/HupF family hydrogenase formation chaperone [Ignavibacteriae bacterium]|nr:HypC/HybG/HupF family hydrogenase formation chaperone [Ignavibacteriota bacterium]
MTLLTGEITEIFVADFAAQARIKVGGAYMRSSLFLVPDASVGDSVLIEGGVIISKLKPDELPSQSETQLRGGRAQ